MKFKGIRNNFARATAIAALVTAATLMIFIAGCSVPKTESQVPRITISHLKAKIDAGENIIVIDTRPKVSYDEVHIVGSISIPEEEIAARSSELEDYGEIVTYCT